MWCRTPNRNMVSPEKNPPVEWDTKGENDAVTFTADKAGEYALICYVPGHAAAGMWINFTVADGGTAGVTAGGMGGMGAPGAPAATGATGTTGQ